MNFYGTRSSRFLIVRVRKVRRKTERKDGEEDERRNKVATI